TLARYADGGRRVETAQAAHGRVHHDTAKTVDAIRHAPLQKQVHRRPDVADVAKEVRHAVAHRIRQHGLIGPRDRLEHGTIDRIVELVDRAVHALQGIAWVGLARHG